jgi:hypothetical protein
VYMGRRRNRFELTRVGRRKRGTVLAFIAPKQYNDGVDVQHIESRVDQ